MRRNNQSSARTAVISRDVPGLSLQDVHAFFLRSDTFTRYHKQKHRQDLITVYPWLGNVRPLEFVVPLKAPAVVIKLAGASTIRVSDSHTVELHHGPGGDLTSFRMTSHPVLHPPLGDVEMGSVAFVVERATLDGQEGCKFAAHIACCADNPWLWAFKGLVERIMLKECSEIGTTFIDFCAAHAAGAAALPPEEVVMPQPLKKTPSGIPLTADGSALATPSGSLRRSSSTHRRSSQGRPPLAPGGSRPGTTSTDSAEAPPLPHGDSLGGAAPGGSLTRGSRSRSLPRVASLTGGTLRGGRPGSGSFSGYGGSLVRDPSGLSSVASTVYHDAAELDPAELEAWAAAAESGGALARNPSLSATLEKLGSLPPNSRPGPTSSGTKSKQERKRRRNFSHGLKGLFSCFRPAQVHP